MNKIFLMVLVFLASNQAALSNDDVQYYIERGRDYEHQISGSISQFEQYRQEIINVFAQGKIPCGAMEQAILILARMTDTCKHAIKNYKRLIKQLDSNSPYFNSRAGEVREWIENWIFQYEDVAKNYNTRRMDLYRFCPNSQLNLEELPSTIN